MSSAYNLVKQSKLKLKGESSKPKKKKRKIRELKSGGHETAECLNIVGDWWVITKLDDIRKCVAIELKANRYLFAKDNGSYILGDEHPKGPAPEEIFTVVSLTERRIALKSGYGKYLSVKKDGSVQGRADAIGPLEHLEPVIDAGKIGLQAFNEKFMGAHEEGRIAAINSTIGDNENLKIRTNADKEVKVKKVKQDEMMGTSRNCERNYVKMYQSYGDGKLLMNSETNTPLKKARKDGSFHECLLDRREKMKADRYCK